MLRGMRIPCGPGKLVYASDEFYFEGLDGKRMTYEEFDNLIGVLYDTINMADDNDPRPKRWSARKGWVLE